MRFFMKKVRQLLLTGALLCGCMASAESFEFIQFTTSDGSKTTVNASGLKIAVNGSQIVVTNSESKELSYNINDLVSMTFTNESGITDVNVSDGETFVLFDINGMNLGEFDSLIDASTKLPYNTYIIRKNDGSTYKIMIGK